jgi:hypothetical protein
MNIRLILFSAILTSAIGGVVGIGVGKAFAPGYESRIYRELPSKYGYVGAATGLLIGGCQEAVRQLKKQRDEEDRQRRF